MQNEQKRPDWNEYFIGISEAASKRSTCDRGKPACVIVKNNQILATGYAGSPPGFPHCDDVGHEMEERIRFINIPKSKCGDEAEDRANAAKEQIIIEEDKKCGIRKDWIFNHSKSRYETIPTQHCIRTIHAEQNAIIQAARKGVSIEGSTVYLNMTPCRTCSMFLIAVGIKRIVCKKRYHASQDSEYMFKVAGIELVYLEEGKIEYANQ